MAVKMMTKKYLFVGLDVATKIGFSALLCDALNPETCLIQMKPKNKADKPQDKPLNRAMYLSHAVVSKIGALKEDFPDREIVVIIEGYSLNSKFNLASMVEVGTAVRLALLANGYGYYEVPPTTLKKFITGKGNGKKEVIMMEVLNRFNVKPDTNDEADAIGLSYVGKHLTGLEVKLPKTHIDTVKGAVKFIPSNEVDANFLTIFS